ncbi:TIGR03758 family integrating conjugative element protein [Pseudomonas sp. S5D5]|jgi:integrating conjugative element protein (TIGR03758 family)|uniref:TIGR03758 family integrating conjugative element protein n=1 Tax=Pseudomonas sp. S5D5 TaxID=2083056 RepID=UPI000D0E80C7|nr:TIGR03758 family integrating conjugative element protein [Pseudomonas sp. S5D5]AYF50023.1 TIGR03758 family integrating conjugative element protein [Pseudomonas fluorescens]QTV15923.1 TIGR03758 family integrating conjugative element protein [Pseudomonas fluorescens]
MSMSPQQVTAFQAMGGFTPQQSTTLFIGLVLSSALLFAAWALASGYRGWATGQISQAKFVGLTLKVILIYILLTFLLLH